MQTTSTDALPGSLMTRRQLLAGCAVLVIAGPARARRATPSELAPRIQVWKGPSCGCCKDWIRHLETNGFQVSVSDAGNTNARKQLGVDIKYGSCHTGLAGGYAIEGHVPVREIRRLLRERPQALGLAVPAMPIGSPGMDGPEYGQRKDPYDVLLLNKDGSARTYQTYR
ncbi:DUF411 domain-containing protein [Paucibacter sp. JuS9]|uniref:DUF411 domain-containing protein n=1 Tax=Roseateles TaxID=93681 RepID=UPI002FE522C4